MIVLFGLSILLFSVTLRVDAATTKKKVITKASPAIGVKTQVARDRRSVSIYFNNLQKTSSVFYTLNYLNSGKSEGAGGTINTKGKYSLSRTLLFGTCSAGVCRYHKNIKNVKITVTVTFRDGSQKTFTYNIKV